MTDLHNTSKKSTLLPTLSAAVLLMIAPLFAAPSAHAGESASAMRVTFAYERDDTAE
jgi:hypothetical protein